MDNEEFDEFWSWLVDEAGDTETYWLNSWLEEQLCTWDKLPVCECGHRATRTEEAWSKTRMHVLSSRIRCANCGKLIKTEDNRPVIIKAIDAGTVRVKDLEILKQELGLNR